CQQGNKHPHSF
nr:immunoglobulin light chain junction region [Macaca mulatta]MOX87241.1 immunoglobulin light chain junction region [Macaca mulatta]MOX87737.1 immunoglobulin light chain junction region [Macaca mulatta]MOX88780.1 immunoglobulin light chain junction region [Macaca mulatta]MOX89397.1 immunoglobulin light chain junction region [Macaca mulatta]